MKIKRSKDWYYRARFVAWIFGMILCVIPTLIAAVYNLPVIVSKDAENTLSGVFIVVLVIAVLPLYKALLKLLKSPSAAVVCWVLFLLIALIERMPEKTIHGLGVVFLTAAIGNTLGAVCFKFSKEFEKLWMGCGEVAVTEVKK